MHVTPKIHVVDKLISHNSRLTHKTKSSHQSYWFITHAKPEEELGNENEGGKHNPFSQN